MSAYPLRQQRSGSSGRARIVHAARRATHLHFHVETACGRRLPIDTSEEVDRDISCVKCRRRLDALDREEAGR